MKDTLKVAGRIGAELGAAKAENEKLRGLLRRAVCHLEIAYQDMPTIRDIKSALSHQAEPAPAQEPVGYQFQDREGVWKQFMNERHYEDTLADGTWPIRAIYAAPIAQAEHDTFCAYCGGNDEEPQDHCMDCTRPLAQTALERENSDLRAQCGGMQMTIDELRAAQTDPQREQSGLEVVAEVSLLNKQPVGVPMLREGGGWTLQAGEKLVRQSEHLAALSAVTAERDRLKEEMGILWKKLDKFDSQSHGITALAENERLRTEVEALKAERDRLEQALGDKVLCAAYAERQKLRAEVEALDEGKVLERYLSKDSFAAKEVFNNAYYREPESKDSAKVAAGIRAVLRAAMGAKEA